MGRAVCLLGFALLDETVFPQPSENSLDDLGMLRGWSTTEDVKIDLEPGIDVAVDGVILGTQSSWIYALRERLRLGSCSILVCTADI